MTAQLFRYDDELCRLFGLNSWLLLKLINFARSTSLVKKILYAWADLFYDEDAANYASGCWPRAFTNRWYSVTHAERRLTSPFLVASSGCSRCSHTLDGFGKIVSYKKAKDTSKQTKHLVTQENTGEMLTAIDSAGSSNEERAQRAQLQARESRWHER